MQKSEMFSSLYQGCQTLFGKQIDGLIINGKSYSRQTTEGYTYIIYILYTYYIILYYNHFYQG